MARRMKKRQSTFSIAPILISAAVVVGIGTSTFIFTRQSAGPPSFVQPSALALAPPVNRSSVTAQNRSPDVSLIAVGDVMLSRAVARKMKAKGLDYPFRDTSEYLRSADMVFANLETPITPGRAISDDELTFRSDPAVVGELKRAGFTVFSLANNHTPNFGAKGLLDTLTYLNRVGLKFAGAGRNRDVAYAPALIEQKGIRFAFLAFNDTDVVPVSYGATEGRAGTAFMDIPRMKTAVEKAKRLTDIVIVSMHSGTEYQLRPNTRQKIFAHAAIDAGADLIIGHHPHVVQPVEKYKGKYILYSLGNFVFDQMWSRQTREGMTAKIVFTKRGLEKIEYTPVLIEDYAKPRLLEGREAEPILARLKVTL